MNTTTSTPRLLLLNANTTAAVTQRMCERAALVAGPQVSVRGATPTLGPAIISSRAENALAAHGVLDCAAREAAGCDAIVLAVSLDTALGALREMLDIPVVGMTEASVLSASLLGARIGFLTLGPQLLPLYQEVVQSYGLAHRVVAWRAPALPAAYAVPPGVDPDIAQVLRAGCDDMIRQDSVDVIVLSGAVLTGYAQALAPQCPVPLVDAIDAATLQALTLVRLRAGQRLAPAKRPTGRVVHGMSEPLRRWFAGEDPKA